MKFDVSGTFVASIPNENYIEASSKEEAINKFKEEVKKKLGDIDWLEWRETEAEPIKDYSGKINRALCEFGYGVSYMVCAAPKLVCSGQPSIPTCFGNMEVYYAKLRNGYDLYFLVNNEQVYLPIYQDNCCLATNAFWDDDEGMNSILRVFWTTKENTYMFNDSGCMIGLCLLPISNGRTMLGKRIQKILENVKNSGYFLVKSESTYIELKSYNGKDTIKATYNSCRDESPKTLVRISNIIP